MWKHITTKFWFSDASQKFLHQSSEKQGNTKYILLGAALGPVFSSCSPTYALILAIILPAGLVFGIAALIAYILGLSLILFLIALLGQKCIKNVKWMSTPGGIFQKTLGIIFILVWLAVLTGYDKKIEAKILDIGFLNTTTFEQSIINKLNLDVIEDTDAAEIDSDFFWNIQKNICTWGKCEKKWLTYSTGNIIGFEAPDLRWLAAWINSPEISSLQELRWKVVMIDFWTLGCINCINTHKNTQELYERYKDNGFIVLGLHAPEFAYEQNIEELQKAVDRFWITFPVAQDNDFATWKAYNNRYWPAFYIIDKKGIVRYTHFGEGGFEKKEEIIEQLLAE